MIYLYKVFCTTIRLQFSIIYHHLFLSGWLLTTVKHHKNHFQWPLNDQWSVVQTINDFQWPFTNHLFTVISVTNSWSYRSSPSNHEPSWVEPQLIHHMSCSPHELTILWTPHHLINTSLTTQVLTTWVLHATLIRWGELVPGPAWLAALPGAAEAAAQRLPQQRAGLVGGVGGWGGW